MDVDSDASALDTDEQSSISEYVGAGAEMDNVSSKAQISFLHLQMELIRSLGIKATPVFHEAFAVILSSVAWAQRELDVANDELEALATEQTGDDSQATEDSDADNDSDMDDAQSYVSDDEDMDVAVAVGKKSARGDIEHRKSVAREIRQLAIKCITRMFVLEPPNFSFAPYMQCIYEVAIDPRIDNLASENTQNSSALLLLLKSWTLTPKYYPYLVDYNPLTFPMLLDILVAPKVQSSVVSLVLGILQMFLDYDPQVAVHKYELSAESAEAYGVLVKGMIQRHISRILSHMRTCFSNSNLNSATTATQSGGSGNLVMHQIHILSRVAEYATEETQDAKALLDLLLPTLKRPGSVVPARTKGDVLNIML
ncbi:U3 snoRNP protein, partial [Coemansia sp. RSA 1287]